MWKNTEQEEYEASAPAVKAHFHALRAEEAWKREDYAEVTREARLASEKFIEAANAISDKRTIDALMLLAENYEYRAHAAHAKIPERAEEKKKESALNEDEGVSPATRGEVGLNGKKSPITMAVGGREPMKVQGFTPMSSGLEALDPRENAQATDQLNQAAEEIEELWRRLHELGLSGGGNADKNHLLMSSRHLSSSLGDSFCLLPTKARTPIGAQAVAIDGGSTLRAAVASRMRNQRVRLMEKQYGPRAAVDARLQPPRAPHTGGSKEPSPSFKEASRPQSVADHHETDRRSSLSGRGSDIHDSDSLQETVKHQKYEIVRLLNTVKTLSNENTTLLKKCDALSQVQEENRELQDAMDKFKTLYNQKLVRIKRALEEWKRQQAQSQRDGSTAAAPPPTRDSDLDGRLQQQQLQIQQLTATLAKRDAQVAKYEQWYQTLKAGARAKRNQNEAGGVDGAGTVPRDSFTNSNSLHELNRGSNGNLVDSMNASGGRASSTLPHSSSRPPAHPTRRAL